MLPTHLLLMETHDLRGASDLVQGGEALQRCVFLGNRTDTGTQRKGSARRVISTENCCDRFVKAGRKSKKQNKPRQPGLPRD